jgi:hypothetical protein
MNQKQEREIKKYQKDNNEERQWCFLFATQSSLQWASGVIYPGVKWLRQEAGSSYPCSAELKNISSWHSA